MMEYAPQPLFKQGVSARAKVFLFSFMALMLLAVDSRMHTLSFVRPVIGAALYPFQKIMLLPRDIAYEVMDYYVTLSHLKVENQRLQYRQIFQEQQIEQAQWATQENERLRKLLDLQLQVPTKSLVAEILYDTHDPFTRKIILNKGTQSGVSLGQPVIDEVGVVGQVTRVFLLTSEVTLLTDKDQAIFVQITRSGLRSVVYGRGQSGLLELRFMAANSDIKVGDHLTTSGLDGIYPSGLSVATVVQVNNGVSGLFGHMMARPTAGIDHHKQLLILLREASMGTPLPMEEMKKKPENTHLKRGTR